jgi:hypothetical protein
MSGVLSNGDSFRLSLIFICFVIGMVPGMWAAWRGLKALAYYLKLKVDGENVVN